LNYAFHEIKNLSEPAYQRLSEYMEQRHKLLEVRIEDGQCIAKYPNGEFAFPSELREKLVPLVGQIVAVLRLDGYRVRKVVDVAP
jgi:hypothetical protein